MESSARAILADNFYNAGMTIGEALQKSDEVLDELEANGFVLVYSPRKDQK